MSAVADIQARFPDVDRVTIEETLELCEGDAGKCAAVLTEVLAEEAAAARPSALRTLLDGVSLLAQIPRDDQPEAQRLRILSLCTTLESSGVFLAAPVSMLLDGCRERADLTRGLDEADRVVTLQLLELVEAGGSGSLDGLTFAERQELSEEFGTRQERAQARELERVLKEKAAALAAREQELKALKKAAIKQRLAENMATGQ